MKRKMTSVVLASAVGLMFSSVSRAEEAKHEAAAAPAATTEATVNCTGNNACKGHGNCKTASNACAGKNGCKGHVTTTTAKDCKAKGGKVEGQKAEKKDKHG